jgi:hypothetical protein
MIKEIEKKLLTLVHATFTDAAKVKIDKLDLFDFIYTDIKLEGSNITAEGVVKIMDGGMAYGGTLEDHESVEFHKDTLKLFREMAEMQTTVDSGVIARIYSTLLRDPAPEFRRANLVLYELDFTPPFFGGIKNEMLQLLTDANGVWAESIIGKILKRAATLHDGIVRIQPYEKGNGMLARAVMQYELEAAGLPLVQIGLSDTAYNTMMAETVKGKGEGIHPHLITALDKKLNLILSLA